jgi:hypothetical protein
MHVYAYAQFTYLSGESREKNRKIERERERGGEEEEGDDSYREYTRIHVLCIRYTP